MNQRRLLPLLLCLTLALLGCGDSPRAILREGIATWNELADLLARIPDDDTADQVAAELYKNHIDPLKKRFDTDLRKRVDAFGKLDKDGKKDLDVAVGDLKEDAAFAISRLEALVGGTKYWPPDDKKKLVQVRGRLTEIMKKLAAKRLETKSLAECVKAVEAFAVKLPDPPMAPPTPGQEKDKDKTNEPNLVKYKGYWQFPGSGGSGGGFPGGQPGGPPGGFPKPPGS